MLTLVLPYSVACPSIMLPPLEGACPPAGLCASAASSSRHAAASPSPRLGILVGRLSPGLFVSPKASLGGVVPVDRFDPCLGPGPACSDTRAMLIIGQILDKSPHIRHNHQPLVWTLRHPITRPRKSGMPAQPGEVMQSLQLAKQSSTRHSLSFGW